MIRQSLSRFIHSSSSTPLVRCFSSSASPHLIKSSNTPPMSLFYPPSPINQPKFLLPPDLFVTSTPSKANRLFSSHVEEQISHYARRQQQGVTLKQMLDIGPTPSNEAVIRNARFLYEELPVRLAKRVRELESLPYGLSQTAPVLKVKSWYVQSFRDILSCNEPVTPEEDQHFAATLEKILERHANVVPTIAAGVLHLKKQLGGERGTDIVTQCPFLQDFLNRFYASRIGIRLLIAQHVALHHPRPGWIGCVAMEMNPIHVAEEAAADAVNICEREYGRAPEVKIIAESVKGLSFIPAHLHHIVFELLKNSLRAIVENNANKSDYPTVELILVCENREFALKIADQGGGIPRKDMPRIWTYMHTTAKKPTQDLLNSNGDINPIVGGGSYGSHGANTGSAPMAGFGYGLPLSRLTARYFGGDLQLVSTHGHGTDAYLYLTRLEDLNIVME